MPPPLLFDLSKIDIQAEPVFDKEAIESVNLQRYQMQQLDGVIWYDKAKRLILGYKDVTDKEFWIAGHIPGRPLMPAVIMIESAAQLLSFFVRKIVGVEGFIGFLSIDDTKFRLPVVPGQRLYLLGHLIRIQTRKYTARVQGVIDGNMAFETIVSGMVV